MEGEGSGKQRDNGQQLGMGENEGRQAGGKRSAGAERMLMWEGRLFLPNKRKAFLLLLLAITLQCKRGPRKNEWKDFNVTI